METLNVWKMVLGIGALNVLLFVVIWCGVIALLAGMSGWKRLARRYAAPTGASPGTGSEQTFRSASAFLNGVRYRHCLTVTVGPEGVGLALWPLFRMGQPPLRIPWTAVRSVAPVKIPVLGDGARLEVSTGDARDSTVRLVVSGDVGRAVLAARPSEVAAYGVAAPYPPPVGY